MGARAAIAKEPSPYPLPGYRQRDKAELLLLPLLLIFLHVFGLLLQLGDPAGEAALRGLLGRRGVRLLAAYAAGRRFVVWGWAVDDHRAALLQLLALLDVLADDVAFHDADRRAGNDVQV